MGRPEKRRLERVRYWQGQMLRSRDFRDLDAVEAQRRWWHNRALHRANGVYAGLETAPDPPTGPLNMIRVQPGVAYDCFGRELILDREQSVPLPSHLPSNTSTRFSLLVHYQTPQHDLPANRAAEFCFPQQGGIRRGTIEFAWKPTNLIKPTDGVSIGELEYGRNKQARLLPNFIPAAARALARPVLATGVTIPGNTAWEAWNFGAAAGREMLHRNFIGVQTRVDTASAGFTRVPCYFAWLQGSIWNPEARELMPTLFPSIAEESITGFTFRLWLTVTLPVVKTEGANFARVPNLAAFSLFAQQQGLCVSWIGCQMPASTSVERVFRIAPMPESGLESSGIG